jgi:hypothetical protein
MQQSTPEHIIITPYSQEDDDCSELMPRCHPVPMTQQQQQTTMQSQVQIPPSPSGEIQQQHQTHHYRRHHHHYQQEEHDVRDVHGEDQRLQKENQQLRTILRDLGLSSLLPNINHDTANANFNVNSTNEELSSHSSQLSVSYFQHLNAAASSKASINAAKTISVLDNACTAQTGSANDNTDILLAEIQAERNQLIQMTQLQSTEISNLQSEIHALAHAHDSAKNESSRIQSELSSLRTHLQQERHQVDSLQNDLRTMQDNRNALWRDLNASLEGNRELEQEFHQNQRLLQQCLSEKETLQKEYCKQENRGDALEREVQKRIAQVADLENEKEQNFIERDRSQNAMRVMEKEKGELVRDLESSRLNSEYNCSKTLELQQLAAKWHGDSEAFQGMVMELEEERNGMRKLFEEERGKVQVLEEVLSNVKVDEGAAGEQIRKLVREKAQIVTKLNEANARLERSTLITSSISRDADHGFQTRFNVKVKGTKLFSPSGESKHAHTGTKHSVSFAPFDETDTITRKALEEKQRAVEISLQELELVSPLPNHLIGSSVKKAGVERSGNTKRYAPSLSKKTINRSNGNTLDEKENQEPREGKEDEDKTDSDSLSLLEPLSLHDSLSPPTKISLKRESQSLLDFLSQDDASTLI